MSENAKECERCKGVFEPLSRQASQNAMGPWFIRDEANPFRPGCSYGTMRLLVARKRIVPESVLRGPSTRQFWMLARNVPGVAHLLGECHACHGAVSPSDAACGRCGASFAVEEDRQYLGLAEVRLLPGQAAPEAIARVAAPTPVTRPTRGSDEIDLAADEPAPEPAQEPASTVYEPMRHPSRPAPTRKDLSDQEIDAMLRRGREGGASGPRRASSVVMYLVVAAVLVMLLVVVAAIAIIGSSAAKKSAAGVSGAAGTTGR